MSAAVSVDELWQERPRSGFIRGSLIVFTALIFGCWFLVDVDWADLVSARRMNNLERFLREIRPFPLHELPWSWSAAWQWAREFMGQRGLEAVLATLAISLVAIVLATLGGALGSLLAARTIAAAEPYLPESRAPSRTALWTARSLVASTRAALIGLRCVPEYVWAFLFVALVGPHAWAAILALGLHNAGILGRLGAETVENADPAPLRALRALGARRSQIAATGVLPLVLPRFLLYFSYRWETCVREATVLGMLGIASLGYWVEDARTRGHYDTLLLLVVLGALIVLAGDLLSTVLRRVVRRA